MYIQGEETRNGQYEEEGEEEEEDEKSMCMSTPEEGKRKTSWQAWGEGRWGRWNERTISLAAIFTHARIEALSTLYANR